MSRTLLTSSTLLSGLVDYWTLNEASGNRTGVKGTVLSPTGTPLPGSGPGKLGNALSLASASGQYLQADPSAASAFNPGSGSFTLAGWFTRATTGTTQNVFQKNGSTGNRGYVLQLGGSNQLQLFVSPDGTAQTSAASPVSSIAATNQWYFFAAWLDESGQTLNIQVNNGLINSVAYTSGVVFATTQNLFLGANNLGLQTANGLLDGFGYWNRALTAGERALLWGNGNGLEYPFTRPPVTAHPIRSGLVDYWKLDEGSGTCFGVNGNRFVPDTSTGTSSPTFTPNGKLGNCRAFSAALFQRFTNAFTPASFSPAGTAFTVGCWFNSSTLGTSQGLVTKWSGANATSEWRLIRTTTNAVEVRVADGSGTTAVATSVATASASAWHLALGWYDPATNLLSVQLDGRAPVTASVPFTITAATGRQVELGAIGGGSNMDGLIDSPFYFSRVLDATERALLWNQGAGIEYPFVRPPKTAHSLQNGLVEYWKLDEGSGTRVGVNGTQAVPQNSPHGSMPGKLGRAAVGNGSNLFLVVSDATQKRFSPGVGDATMCAWFYSAGSALVNFLQRTGSSDGHREYRLSYNPATQKILFVFNPDGTNATAQSVTANGTGASGIWHFAALRKQGATLSITLNNNPAATTTAASGVIFQSDQDFILGSTTLSGGIDAVGYWNRALSDAELVQLYNLGAGQEYPFVRPPVTASSLQTNLVDYWKLEEPSGNRVGVNGTALAPTNAPGNAVGKLGTALQFVRASSQFLSLPSGSAVAFSPGSAEFSVSAWVYFDSLSSGRTLIGKFAAAAREWRLDATPTQFRFLGSTDGTTSTNSVTAGSTLVTGQWYHVVGVRDNAANLLRLFINGQQAGSVAITAGTALFTSGQELDLGKDQSGNFMDGRLDAVGYWSRALTQTEVALLFNMGAGSEYPFVRSPCL